MTELLQQRWDDPWRVLVSCILLNVTTRKQVDRVVDDLFQAWPSAEEMANAQLGYLEDKIESLGLGHQRAQRIKKLSTVWASFERMSYADSGRLFWPPKSNVVKDLPGVGRYALDSYKIFVLGEDLDPYAVFDKELRAYLIERRNGGGQADSQGGERGDDHDRASAGGQRAVPEGHGR